jgi:hypothetical protein
MERVGTLINKLKDQFEQQAGADKLAVTAQLLLAELQKNHAGAKVTSKVSVVLPSVSTRGRQEERQEEKQEEKQEAPAEKKEPVGTNWLFETSTEIPTLVHQQVPAPARTKEPAVAREAREVNKTLATPAESLNEKLKEERTEVMTTLQDTPVRDLKKAIGINDRYLFVNDLFRGDENMYERSIKTINGFSIYPEAQYWIQRELKVKLSWPDNSETVRLFDQVIKRRFS